MASDGTDFEIRIPVDGGQAASAADSVRLLSDQLERADAAAIAAANAVKQAESAYNAAEIAADRAAKGHEKISLAVDAQKVALAGVIASQGMFSDAAMRAADKLAQLEARQTEMATKAATAKAALTAEAASLDKLKSAAETASQAQDKIAKAHDAAKKAADASGKAAQAAAGSGKVNEIAEGLGKLGGPLGVTGQKLFGVAEGFKKMSASLGSAGPYVAIAVAITAIAVSLGALTIAAGVAAVKVTAWGIANADAARSNELLAAGIARSARGGDELIGKVDELLGKVPASKDELMGLAKTLADGGLRGKALTDALETSAIAAAKLKFGPDFAKEMISLPRQSARFQNNLSKLFSGLQIEPFLKALDLMGDLFDANNASGRAIKAVFESMFQPLVDGATGALPKLRTNFIAAEIAVMKGLIQMKKTWQEWGDTITAVVKIVAILTAIIIGGLVVALVFVAVNLAIIGAAFGFVVGAITALVVGAVLLGAKLLELGVAANDAIMGGLKSAFDAIANFSLIDTGTALIDGLVLGITNGAAKVAGALKGVVDGAVKGAKSALGIASPSKVFEEIGGFTAEGMAVGVDGGAADVSSAMTDMALPPAALETATPAAPAAPAPAGPGGGGGTFTINMFGGDAFLRDQLEKLLMQCGMTPAPTGGTG